MHRRVEGYHAVGERIEDVPVPCRLPPLLEPRRGEELRVFQDEGHVGMTGNGPHAARLDLGDWLVTAHVRVDWIRVGPNLGWPGHLHSRTPGGSPRRAVVSGSQRGTRRSRGYRACRIPARRSWSAPRRPAGRGHGVAVHAEHPFDDPSKSVLDPASVRLDVVAGSTGALRGSSSRSHELGDALVVPPRDGGDGLCRVAPLAVLVVTLYDATWRTLPAAATLRHSRHVAIGVWRGARPSRSVRSISRMRAP